MSQSCHLLGAVVAFLFPSARDSEPTHFQSKLSDTVRVLAFVDTAAFRFLFVQVALTSVVASSVEQTPARANSKNFGV
jgi:hypothetical protein